MQTQALITMRNREFAAALRREASPQLTKAQIVQRALSSRPSRFYLEFETVMAHLYNHHSHRQTPTSRSPSRLQWDDIHQRITSHRRANPSHTLAQAVSHVLNHERPSRFYISHRTAHTILRHMLYLNN